MSKGRREMELVTSSADRSRVDRRAWLRSVGRATAAGVVAGIGTGGDAFCRGARGADEPRDLASVEPDLTVAPLVMGEPAAGRRVVAKLAEYTQTEVHHALYLPSDWRSGGRYPVFVEYPGNGPYRNEFGDVCEGEVGGCRLGYGLTAGQGWIWLCLPLVSADRQKNQRQWWGSVAATVEYCHWAVERTCRDWGGDPDAVVLAGFSRGSIAANYIGLRDDSIARRWRAFVCHSHYDGVRRWGYDEDDRAAAAKRLARLRGRPQFISHERSVDATREYLAEACPDGNFTFQPIGFRNHSDAWTLRDLPERRAAREWLRRAIG